MNRSNLFVALIIVLVLVVAGVYVLFLRPQPATPAPTVTAPTTLPSATRDSNAFNSPIPQQTDSVFQSPLKRQSEQGRPAAVVTASPSEGISVELVTDDDVRLAGTYLSPETERQVPGVILLHMLGRSRQDWLSFAQRLQAEGYAVLAIDLRGHGKSGGEQNYTSMRKDAAAAFAWLVQRPVVDMRRIGVVGASIGANIGLDFAASQLTLRSIVLLSPGLDYRGVTTEDAIVQYGARPLLIVASNEDTYAADSSRKLDSMAQGKHELQMFDGAAHGTDMLESSIGLTNLLLSWLQETLGEG